MSDPSVTDHIEMARQYLNKALRAGVQKGRLKQGQPGKKGAQSYWIVSKAQRREVLVKYNKNKKAVEFNDVDDFSNPKVCMIILTFKKFCYGKSDLGANFGQLSLKSLFHEENQNSDFS